jgi:hypothetical protein
VALATGACSSADNSPPYMSPTSTTAGSPVTGAAGSTATTASGTTATAGRTGTTSATGTAGAGTTTTTTTTTTGAAGGAAAGAGGTAAVSGPATFTAVLAAFTGANCGLCHGMATIGGGLMFKPEDAMGTYTALVGPVSAGTNSSMCGGKTYVVPGMPDASLLYDKVSKTTPMCGARMPATGVPLTDDQIKTVHDWIMAGAKND